MYIYIVQNKIDNKKGECYHLSKRPLLERRGFGNQHHDETRYHQGERHHGNQRHAASADREFPSDDPVLGFEIAVEADEQGQNADPEEGGAERLSELAQTQVRVAVGGIGEARAEAEQLRDGDADGREREGRSEPGQERPFWRRGAGS